MEKLKLLDLFSGIGGFSLGLEASDYFETVAFCEINPKCHPTLSRHWPGVPIFDDVTTLDCESLRARNIVRVDAICGGFPCQDISLAGSGEGLVGERSGLWREFARLIGELRPGILFVENVAALLGRGAGDVLGDLATLGYDAEWHCIPAGHIGLPHERDRFWLVAYPTRSRLSRLEPQRSAIVRSCAQIAKSHRAVSRAWQTLDGSSGDLCGSDGISFGLAKHVINAYGNAVTPLIPQALGSVFGPEAILSSKKSQIFGSAEDNSNKLFA